MRLPGYVANAILPIALIVVALQWYTDAVTPDQLVREVPAILSVSWLESHYTYFYLHAFTLIPILFLSFDKKVGYYKLWRFLFPAIIMVGICFILWDAFFTAKGVWGFNPAYVSDLFVLDLPLEEWLFFVTVPFACVFVYECLRVYISRDWLAQWDKPISIVLIIGFLLIGVMNWSRMYTFTYFFLAGALLLWHVVSLPNTYRTRFYLAYAVSWIPFFLVNGILTGACTEAPVVMYNPEEQLGLRMITVPVEDAIYSFVLFLGVVTLFERFRTGSPKMLRPK